MNEIDHKITSDIYSPIWNEVLAEVINKADYDLRLDVLQMGKK